MYNGFRQMNPIWYKLSLWVGRIASVEGLSLLAITIGDMHRREMFRVEGYPWLIGISASCAVAGLLNLWIGTLGETFLERC